jgi:hypothetical protein
VTAAELLRETRLEAERVAEAAIRRRKRQTNARTLARATKTRDVLKGTKK